MENKKICHPWKMSYKYVIHASDYGLRITNIVGVYVKLSVIMEHNTVWLNSVVVFRWKYIVFFNN